MPIFAILARWGSALVRVAGPARTEGRAATAWRPFWELTAAVTGPPRATEV